MEPCGQELKDPPHLSVSFPPFCTLRSLENTGHYSPRHQLIFHILTPFFSKPISLYILLEKCAILLAPIDSFKCSISKHSTKASAFKEGMGLQGDTREPTGEEE